MTPIRSNVDAPAGSTFGLVRCVSVIAQLADGDRGYEPAGSRTGSATSARRTR